ncbi:N-acetyl-alpha-D-glucosaminyl-diphospho-ditrans, octacis-undecaprenol 4-epimerase [Achromobacter veterisilvae]|uniref:N-acetyl-alpha-D-glucosaminyl-diphospho-ditrans, octacis-undecaprenol 4-epimerase n=1 Tax=Achromobacter veterisilvae TaxID=2069367 RepID=A0A446CPN3_9BURK|nr:NAD-dependent epimerase/dehydratase family protein [Achromobacter veterisilvae]SSW69718.1 N-acetyl-alpha-D-glucosaminyl-diphospho-ditrans, octacis-undecaprenol 4-epimerase [Achromobacter veterisilvae]
MDTSRVLVTGGTGFVGQRVVRDLLEGGGHLRLLTRRPVADPRFEVSNLPDIADDVALRMAMAGVDVVCHLAGRAHVLGKAPADHEAQFEKVNVDWTRRLAKAAFESGVRRFVFVSSVGAVANYSVPGEPLHENSACRPTTPYGKSKLKAEGELAILAGQCGAELVIVRPPLVYGKGAPGNMARLARWVNAGIPLPLSNISNQRSLIHVDNLSSVLCACITKPQAAGHVFHVRDAYDYSTPEILRRVALALHRPVHLFPVWQPLLRTAAKFAGQSAAYEQLSGWLQVNDSLVRKILGFQPAELPFELSDAVSK